MVRAFSLLLVGSVAFAQAGKDPENLKPVDLIKDRCFVNSSKTETRAGGFPPFTLIKSKTRNAQIYQCQETVAGSGLYGWAKVNGFPDDVKNLAKYEYVEGTSDEEVLVNLSHCQVRDGNEIRQIGSGKSIVAREGPTYTCYEGGKLIADGFLDGKRWKACTVVHDMLRAQKNIMDIRTRKAVPTWDMYRQAITEYEKYAKNAELLTGFYKAVMVTDSDRNSWCEGKPIKEYLDMSIADEHNRPLKLMNEFYTAVDITTPDAGKQMLADWKAKGRSIMQALNSVGAKSANAASNATQPGKK